MLSRKHYIKVGENGDPQKVVHAFRRHKPYKYQDEAKNGGLLEGAVKAFHAGRPANLQALFKESDSLDATGFPNVILQAIALLAKDGLDPVADVEQALGSLSAQERQALLDQQLVNALPNDTYGTQETLRLLLDCGADINATIDGFPAMPLVTAVAASLPLPTVAFLYENGADFEEALTTMITKGYDAQHVDRLKFYREKLGDAAAPAVAPAQEPAASVAAPSAAPASDEVRDLLREILQEMKEITRRLPPPQAPANTDTPRAATSHPYPKAF